jgi:hypothetical protein
MFFKKKPRTPLQEIVKSLDDLNAILYKYLRDKSYMPTEDDLKQLRLMYDRYHTGYAFTSYVQQRLNQRFLGLPEISDRWTEEKMDYYGGR